MIESQMPHSRSPFLAARLAANSALIAAPSATRAAVPDPAQSVSLDQATIRRLIGGVTVKLREDEDYVFPDKGMQADALETALAENASAGVADSRTFALQLTEQLRAITKDGHMPVIFGSPFCSQPSPSAPQDAGFRRASP